MLHQSGVRKKKSLTDLVEIIPFPNQELRKRISGTPKKSIPKKTAYKKVQDKPSTSILSTPSGSLKTSIVSINQMMRKEEEVVNKQGSTSSGANLPHADFDFDSLKMYWRRFAQIMKEKRKETFYNAMIKREPNLSGNTIIVMEVDNQVQIDYITPYLPELIDYLRKELKNYSIELSMKLTENQEQDVRYKTGKDKFASLAQKNPNLNTLKNTFNLDIEY